MSVANSVASNVFSRLSRTSISRPNQSRSSRSWTGEGIFSRIKAESERDDGSIRKYVTVASKRSNAESGKKTKPGGFGLYDQVTKRTWWMPWRQKAMKDV